MWSINGSLIVGKVLIRIIVHFIINIYTFILIQNDSYRDGGLHVHPSVLSSLSASYSREDLGYYDDLARNLDANLAEIDMESFRTADIHTLLTALPVMCTDPVQHSEVNKIHYYIIYSLYYNISYTI